MDELRYQLSGGIAVHLIWVNIPGYAYLHRLCIDPKDLDEYVEQYGTPTLAIYYEEVVHFR